VELTPSTQYALNDAKSATTGETPNYIVFGTERTLEGEKRTDEQELSHAARMKVIHTQVRLDIEWQEQMMKKYYDKRRSETPKYQQGDRVYIR